LPCVRLRSERLVTAHEALYRIVAQHYPAFVELLAGQGRPLPDYVQQEFEAYLKCARLEHGFLRVRCASCHAEHLVAFSCKRRGFCPSCGARRMAESAALLVDEVFPEQPVRQWVLSVPYPLRFLFASRPDIMGAVLGIVYRVIATHLARKAGFSAKRARTGAVTLIQPFGGALNLNVHFHMLFLDGVYVEGPDGALTFRWVRAPSGAELSARAGRIASRVGRFLERQGLLEHDAENPCLCELALDDEPMEALPAHSITYRIALGPRAGRKVFTLQTLPASDEPPGAAAGKIGGFSLHAGVAARADERGQRAAVPHHQPPGGVTDAPVAHTERLGARPTEDALLGRHHARALRAAGFPRPAGRAGAQTTSEPHPLPRRVRAEQRAPGAGDPGRAGQGRKRSGSG
jgi:ribosomal protein S27E